MWNCPSLQVYKPLYFSVVLYPIPYPQSIPSCDFNRLWASSKITCSPLTLIFYSLSASLCVTTLILPLSPLPPLTLYLVIHPPLLTLLHILLFTLFTLYTFLKPCPCSQLPPLLLDLHFTQILLTLLISSLLTYLFCFHTF